MNVLIDETFSVSFSVVVVAAFFGCLVVFCKEDFLTRIFNNNTTHNCVFFFFLSFSLSVCLLLFLFLLVLLPLLY